MFHVGQVTNEKAPEYVLYTLVTRTLEAGHRRLSASVVQGASHLGLDALVGRAAS